MSKFAIDAGHGCYPDTGAEGYLNEQDCALAIANSAIAKLQSLGHEAWNVRPSNAYSVTHSLSQRCQNATSADYLISIHLNAGDGVGSEVFAMSNSGYELANRVQTELVNLGFVNRGVKDGSKLYVIRHSNPVAILIEVCFVDTASDADLYNSLGVDAIASAIVKGLTGQTVSINKIREEKVMSQAPKYSEVVPEGNNIFKIPNTSFYIEEASDGRMIIHKDRGNYIAMGKGFCDVYVNDNNGHGDSKRILGL